MVPRASRKRREFWCLWTRAAGACERLFRFPLDASTVSSMLTFIIILLAIWAVLAVLGFAIKGLVWLAFIGIILFVATAIIGWIRGRASKK